MKITCDNLLTLKTILKTARQVNKTIFLFLLGSTPIDQTQQRVPIQRLVFSFLLPIANFQIFDTEASVSLFGSRISLYPKSEKKSRICKKRSARF